MLNIIATILVSIITSLGVMTFNPVSIWDKPSNLFGTASFPTSLAVLTNPNSTDSVATVSHSSQHANANDEIEAIEAKIGITASTPVTNSILAGNGAGSSLWTTHATTTNFTATGLGTFGTLTSTGLGTFASFISQASSTIIGGLTIAGNSTTTNATTTVGAFTSYATSTAYYGAGLTACSGSSFLQWTGGAFDCQPVTTSASAWVATSSTAAALTIGPLNVSAGDTFLIWGKSGYQPDPFTLTLTYKQGTETASTTLDSAINDGSVDGGGSLNVQGYFIATTTTTVRFSIPAGYSAGGWSSLIVQQI